MRDAKRVRRKQGKKLRIPISIDFLSRLQIQAGPSGKPEVLEYLISIWDKPWSIDRSLLAKPRPVDRFASRHQTSQLNVIRAEFPTFLNSTFNPVNAKFRRWGPHHVAPRLLSNIRETQNFWSADLSAWVSTETAHSRVRRSGSHVGRH